MWLIWHSQMAPNYEDLILLQKVEVFEYALENTTGQDLYRVLWLKSANSEHWLERRATYTRSLAVNSMVGHILGLGDRHPSNVLLQRHTGKVVHIDFGDCFEVAMHREKYPEKIPFRLTRMLTHAMEVSGIEGSFRITCEFSMKVLRDNKESLMAVLEAFVYDPLITWRLIQHDGDNRRAERTSYLCSLSKQWLIEHCINSHESRPERRSCRFSGYWRRHSPAHAARRKRYLQWYDVLRSPHMFELLMYSSHHRGARDQE